MKTRRIAAGLTAGLTLAVAGTVAGGTPARAAGARPRAASLPASTRYTLAGNLLGVSAYSPSNAFAVGYAGQAGSSGVLITHWNGQSWTRQSPTTAGELRGVADVSATSAWAVGGSGTYPYHPWLLNWNGSAWHTVQLPGTSTGELEAVTATATEAWAVGVNGSGNPTTLHWTQAKPTWVSVSAPVPVSGGGNALDAVAEPSAGNAWAAGEATPAGINQSAVIDYSGGVWRLASFPIGGSYTYVNGLAADAAGLGWGVGADEGGLADPLAAQSMYWNGHSWTAVPVPNAATSTLYGVATGPGHSAWAVGQVGSGTLALRWTGTGWAQTSTPDPLDTSTLEAVAADTTTDAWAVGFGFASASSTAEETLILHWNGSSWS